MAPRLRTIIFCLCLILVSSAVFEGVRTRQFVIDDLGFISRNSLVKEGLTWDGFTWASPASPIIFEFIAFAINFFRWEVLKTSFAGEGL